MTISCASHEFSCEDNPSDCRNIFFKSPMKTDQVILTLRSVDNGQKRYTMVSVVVHVRKPQNMTSHSTYNQVTIGQLLGPHG
jgi:hypothetical protein